MLGGIARAITPRSSMGAERSAQLRQDKRERVDLNRHHPPRNRSPSPTECTDIRAPSAPHEVRTPDPSARCSRGSGRHQLEVGDTAAHKWSAE